MERLHQAVATTLHAPEASKKLAAIGLKPVAEGLAVSDACIKVKTQEEGASRRGHNYHRELTQTLEEINHAQKPTRSRFFPGTRVLRSGQR